MRYCSTRGGDKNTSFEHVLFSGYCSDGGLFVPERFPHLSSDDLVSMSTLSFQDLLIELLQLYIDAEEISQSELKDVVYNAFERFSDHGIVKMTNLANGLIVCELFHGPTLAFKDLGLNVAARLIQMFQIRNRQSCIVLVGTSGDTGGSAVQAFARLKNVDVIVLFPHGRCTDVQQLQMTTCSASNVHVFAVEGNSDDLDVPIKQCLSDLQFSKKHHLLSVNSINWVRILVQIAHYFYSYFRVCEKLGDAIEIAVPCGAAGNTTAGSVAAYMGLPITMVACVGENSVLHWALKEGVLHANSHVHQTLASAMDIQMPYNVERLLFIFSRQNFEIVGKIMSQLELKISSTLPSDLVQEIKNTITDSCIANDNDICAAIYRCWTENSYHICPHTATAVHYHYSKGATKTRKRVCLATASAGKFTGALHSSAVPLADSCHQLSKQLSCLPERFQLLDKDSDWLDTLRHTIEQITSARLQHHKHN